MKRTLPLLTIAAALTVGLAGCSGSPSEVAERDNAALPMDETTAPPSSAPPATTVPPPAPETSAPLDANAAAEVPAEAATLPDEQMMDDASATGMTARATRNEAAADQGQAGDDAEIK